MRALHEKNVNLGYNFYDLSIPVRSLSLGVFHFQVSVTCRRLGNEFS